MPNDIATENTDLKRQLAASANAYGMQLETIEALQQENERLRSELGRR
jgi:cell shape-determining protein MreC